MRRLLVFFALVATLIVKLSCIGADPLGGSATGLLQPRLDFAPGATTLDIPAYVATVQLRVYNTAADFDTMVAVPYANGSLTIGQLKVGSYTIEVKGVDGDGSVLYASEPMDVEVAATQPAQPQVPLKRTSVRLFVLNGIAEEEQGAAAPFKAGGSTGLEQAVLHGMMDGGRDTLSFLLRNTLRPEMAPVLLQVDAQSGRWSGSVQLFEGANRFEVIDTASGGARYNHFSLVGADTTRPRIIIYQPTKNATVTTDSVQVSFGALDNNGFGAVSVNDTLVAEPRPQGGWSCMVPLEEGPNTITVRVKDNAATKNEAVMQLPITYQPRIEPTHHTLTLAVEGKGAFEGIAHALPYDSSCEVGAQLALVAKPAAGYDFAGWKEADVQSQGASLQLSVTEQRTITARFSPQPRTVTLAVQGQGSLEGVATLGDSSCHVDEVLELVPAVPQGYSVYWLVGEVRDSSAVLTHTVSENVTITAVIEPTLLPVSVVVSGSGSIQGGARETTLAWGAVLTLKVLETPEGFRFAGWGGSVNSTDPDTIYTVVGPTTITATFVDAGSFALTPLVAPDTGGTIVVEPDKRSFNGGDSVTLTAKPATGFRFKEWMDTRGPAEPIWSFEMQKDERITASFEKQRFPVFINGTLKLDSANYGEAYPIAVIQPTGQRFVRWERVGGSFTFEDSTKNPTTIRVSADSASVWPVFEPQKIVLTVTRGRPASDSVQYDSAFDIKADSFDGKEFAQWTVVGGTVRIEEPLKPDTKVRVTAGPAEVAAVFTNLDNNPPTIATVIYSSYAWLTGEGAGWNLEVEATDEDSWNRLGLRVTVTPHKPDFLEINYPTTTYTSGPRSKKVRFDIPNALTIADVDTYTVTITATDSTAGVANGTFAERSFELRVARKPVAPRIVTNPPDTVLRNKGQSVAISVGINSDVYPPPTYQWQWVSDNNTVVSTAATLSYAALAYANAGIYRLAVTNHGTTGDTTVFSEPCTLTVRDVTPPQLSLAGSAEVTLVQGAVYSDAGVASATDDKDGDVRSRVQTTNPVPTQPTAGVYTVRYQVIDAAGNFATAYRTVRVLGWTLIEGQLDAWGGSSSGAPAFEMVVDGNGVLTVVFRDQSDGALKARRYDGTSWTDLGTIASGCFEKSMRVLTLSDNRVVVAYINESKDSIVVREFMGGSWVFKEAMIVSESVYTIDKFDFVRDASDDIYYLYAVTVGDCGSTCNKLVNLALYDHYYDEQTLYAAFPDAGLRLISRGLTTDAKGQHFLISTRRDGADGVMYGRVKYVNDFSDSMFFPTMEQEGRVQVHVDANGTRYVGLARPCSDNYTEYDISTLESPISQSGTLTSKDYCSVPSSASQDMLVDGSDVLCAIVWDGSLFVKKYTEDAILSVPLGFDSPVATGINEGSADYEERYTRLVGNGTVYYVSATLPTSGDVVIYRFKK